VPDEEQPRDGDAGGDGERGLQPPPLRRREQREPQRGGLPRARRTCGPDLLDEFTPPQAHAFTASRKTMFSSTS